MGKRWALARGAAEGAVLGAALAASELVTGYLAGGWFSARWWPVIALYDIALGALLGAAAEPFRRALPRGPRVAPAFVALASVYAAIEANRALLPGRPRLSALPLAAAACALVLAVASAVVIVMDRFRRRAGPDGSGLAPGAALLFALAAGTLLAEQVVPRGAFAPFLYLALVFVTVTAAGLLLARLAPWRPAWAVAAAAVALVASACAWGLTGPRPGGRDFQDLPQPAAPGRGSRASVVLIVLDTVRAASVSAYGYAAATTPALDALAHEGVRYADVLTPAPWTVPAHASLFTGLAPSRHGAGRSSESRHVPLDERALTLAEVLSAEGYATAGVSSNRIVSTTFGLTQGFRYFESLPSRDYGFARPPLVRTLEARLPAWLLADRLSEWFPDPGRRAPEVNARARRWLSHRRPAGRPYFLFLNYMDAHTPHRGDPAVVGPPAARASAAWAGLPLAEVDAIKRGLRSARPAEKESLRRAYDADLRFLDGHLGRLLDEVRAQPDGDETWIVVTADHGESLGEHGLGHGCFLNQEVLHVPLVIRPPRSSGIARGTVDPRPVMLTDVFPLLLDGLGLPVPPGLDGRLPGEGRPFRVAETAFPAWLCGSPRGEPAAILDGRFKLIATADGRREELYDRQADPEEAHNLAETRAEDAARLRAWLAQWRSRSPASWSTPAVLDPEREQRLRALGYLP